MLEKQILISIRPEQPFYTVEIVGENISQVRSVNNSTNNVISNVVNDWFNSNKKEILQLYN